ncbi:MAG: enoyl-CoA hydratase [Alphaproteobacteria bacterium]|nr:enoyl-CoA hydratase [Alphaproteobacteria bacterium]
MTAVAEDLNTEPVLLREDRGGVAYLTLNRPRQSNALSEALLSDLQTALDGIAGDQEVRAVVIGATGKAFCAGHDLKEMRSRPDVDYYRRLFNQCSHMMMTLVALPQPVIARVQGVATAAGCQLVATCDLAIAAEEARFATNGINNGLFCSTPSVALSRNLGRKQAFEMLFTGRFVDARTAQAYGLVNRVVPAAELDAAVSELARRIVEKSRVTVSSGKRMFYEQLEKDLDDAYGYAAEVMACDMMRDDAAEGIDAFLEKRRPEWKNR